MTLLVYAYTELSSVEASVERLSDKKRWTFEHGEMSSGDEWECEWEQKAARASYRIHVEAQLADGSSHEHSAEFEVLMVQSLSVELDFERTDLDAGHVALSASAGLARFEMQAFDERKSLLVEQARALDGSKELELSWEPTQESPVYVRISVYDDNDIGVELELFSFDVPHENVVFDSNQSTLRDDQVHKLDATLATIQGALAKYDE
ncbi:MAG: hypothetical protein RBU37_20400, partial [Myxococcota bacterium]|nr:hypothetical protein [Myxococcota bacterium]